MAVLCPFDSTGVRRDAAGVVVPGEPFDGDRLLRYARERLAGYKVPQHLRVRTEPLPPNPGGKVLKTLLRRQVGWGEEAQ